MAKKKTSKIASKKKSSSKKTSTKKTVAKKTAKKPKVAKRRKVNNILLVYREHGTEAKKKAQDLCNWFQERGIKVFLNSKQDKLKNSFKISKDSELSKIDHCIVLGGDGTYLRAVHYLGERNVPVMGINMGSLGFLTETRLEDMYPCLNLLLEGGMDFQYRNLLRVQVKQNGKIKDSWLCLNDVVLERGPYTRLISMAIYSNGNLVSEIRADGLIAATPTGSTAYNLAAGGPIMFPCTEAIAITPICPHSLTTRPMIVPSDHEIRLRIQTQTQNAIFMVDGYNRATLSPNDEIIIRQAKVKHTLVRPPAQSYFELLKSKLNFGQRA
ncbi:MAG: NAD(+)/NADH kinase [Bdellovibrionota bacterium]|nr:NAD(+)/NADH kinase [Bdellovibrionota bacterium]